MEVDTKIINYSQYETNFCHVKHRICRKTCWNGFEIKKNKQTKTDSWLANFRHIVYFSLTESAILSLAVKWERKCYSPQVNVNAI